MHDIFNFLSSSESVSLKIVLGQFVSHQIEWFENDALRTPEDINNMDRDLLAIEFLKNTFYNDRYGFSFQNKSQICRLSEYIDLSLARHYFIRVYEKNNPEKYDRTIYRKYYTNIFSSPGIRFQYEDNYARQDITYSNLKENVVDILEDNGYELKIDSPTFNDLMNIYDFFVNDIDHADIQKNIELKLPSNTF